jgi:hypothetical protein
MTGEAKVLASRRNVDNSPLRHKDHRIIHRLDRFPSPAFGRNQNLPTQRHEATKMKPLSRYFALRDLGGFV